MNSNYVSVHGAGTHAARYTQHMPLDKILPVIHWFIKEF